jgi:threonine 3-dehydrogenase
VIVDGISLHAVVGRRIFETWHITRNLLESRAPDIQEQVWRVILQGGQGTVVPFASWEPAAFEEKIKAHPKVLIQF